MWSSIFQPIIAKVGIYTGQVSKIDLIGGKALTEVKPGTLTVHCGIQMTPFTKTG